MKYTFHNRGTVTSFNPKARTMDASGRPTTLLDVHMDLVRQAGRRDVYIVNHKGMDVDCTSPSLAKAA